MSARVKKCRYCYRYCTGRSLVSSMSRDSAKDALDSMKRIHELIDSIESKQVPLPFRDDAETCLFYTCVYSRWFYALLGGHQKFLVRNGKEPGHRPSNRRSRKGCVACHRLDPWTSWRNAEFLLPGWVRCFVFGGAQKEARGIGAGVQGKRKQIGPSNTH